MKFNKTNFYYNINSNVEHFSDIKLGDPPFTFNDLFTGEIGDQGQRGFEGDVGQFGYTGQRGNVGPKGDKGPIGPRGIIGPKGPEGDLGDVGAKGKRGIRGPKGEIGDTGIKGPIGPRGPQGPEGYTGPMGSRGPVGEKGDKGDQGASGYRGFVSFKYGNNCTTTGWTSWAGKNNEINCPSGKVATKIETECACGSLGGFNSSNWPEKCGAGKTNRIERDCRHKLTCCPVDVYDIGEPVDLVNSRLFFGENVDSSIQERLINKIWITLKPNGLKKSIKDYPPGVFTTENISGGIEILEKEEEKDQILYTNDCQSKFCSKVGQLCTGNKVCLDKINENTQCFKTPCWHGIPEPKEDECNGECEDLGRYCLNENKICGMNNGKKEWIDMPILDKCPGKQCPTPGQTCSIGIDKYNLPGFECKNEPFIYQNNEQHTCEFPPCWFPVNKYVKHCPSESTSCGKTKKEQDAKIESTDCDNLKCKNIGQKCYKNDDDFENNKFHKICLNKETDNCKNPPCWHNVPENSECNNKIYNIGTSICSSQNLKDNQGNDIKDYKNTTVRIPGENCKYEGNCGIIGQQCIDSTGTATHECMNSHKVGDIPSGGATELSYPATYEGKCTKPPCWFPLSGGAPPDLVHLNANLLKSFDFKNESVLESVQKFKYLKEPDVYVFSKEDREGTITFDTLFNFMQKNWVIFEANCIRDHAQRIWNTFTAGGSMNYFQFSGMMRKLRVEKFKYRNNAGRIYPKFMSVNDYKQILNTFQTVDPNNDPRYKSGYI